MSEEDLKRKATQLSHQHGLSDTMSEVIEKMLLNGGRLHREPGGFWVYPGAKVVRTEARPGGNYSYFEWSASVKTLNALERRGIINYDPATKEYVIEVEDEAKGRKSSEVLQVLPRLL